MAIVWTGANTITGLAADTMPTNVPTNTQFFETDTDKTFNFNGSTWDELGSSIDGTTNITIDSTTLTFKEWIFGV